MSINDDIQLKPTECLSRKIFSGEGTVVESKEGKFYLEDCQLQICIRDGKISLTMIAKNGDVVMKSIPTTVDPVFEILNINIDCAPEIVMTWLSFGETTPEQKARDLLERMNVLNAQKYTDEELVELANLISQAKS